MTGLRACHWSGVYEMNGPQQQSSTTAWRRTRHLRRRRTVSPPMSLWLFYVSRQCLHPEGGKTESVSMFVWINIKPSQKNGTRRSSKRFYHLFPWQILDWKFEIIESDSNITRKSFLLLRLIPACYHGHMWPILTSHELHMWEIQTWVLHSSE